MCASVWPTTQVHAASWKSQTPASWWSVTMVGGVWWMREWPGVAVWYLTAATDARTVSDTHCTVGMHALVYCMLYCTCVCVIHITHFCEVTPINSMMLYSVYCSCMYANQYPTSQLAHTPACLTTYNCVSATTSKVCCVCCSPSCTTSSHVPSSDCPPL